MKNPRTFRTLARSLLGAALTSASAFAIAPDDLSALRAKAETGDGIAQHNLGLVYANPQETMTDLVEAYAWLSLAADNGATGRSLMIVTRQMTPEQIADGKRRIEQIRDAIAAKLKNSSGALVTAAPAQKSPVSPVVANPVSGSPVTPVIAPVADTEAQQAELKKISAELAAAWKENDQLKTTAANAAKDAAAATAALKAERDQIAASLENSTREIATMKAAAANFEGERNGLLQKITAAQQASDGELRLKLVALETELGKAAAVAKELEAAKQSLASLGEQQQKLTAENQRINSLLTQAGSTATERAAASEKSLAALRAELTTAQTALADAAKKISAGTKDTADLSAAQTRISALEADAARLSDEKKDLTAKLTAALAAVVPPSEVARTKSELAELKERIATSQQALAQANADVASLKQELQTAKKGVVPVQQHRDLQAKLDAANKLADDQKQALAELKNAREALETEKARLSAELVSANAASADEVAALKAGAANFEGERNGLLKKITDTEKALAAAAVETADLKKQIELSKSETVPAQQLKELEAKLAAAIKARDDEQQARAELQKSFSALEAERAGLSEKLSALTETSTREAAALKAGAANFEGERNGLVQKIDEAGQALERAKAESASLKEQLAAAQAISGEAGRVSADLARVTEERDQLKKSSDESQQALTAAATETAFLKQQLADAKKSTVPAQEKDELRAQLAAITQERDAEKTARAELQKSVAALETERAELTGKLSAVSTASDGEAAGLKAAAANFEGERNGLLKKIEEERQARERAVEEVAGLKEQFAAAAKAGSIPSQEIQDLQAKLDAAVRAQEAAAQQQGELRQANGALELESARLTRELAAAEAAKNAPPQSTGATEELQARLKAAEDAAATAGGERDTLAKRVAALEQQVAAAPAQQTGEGPAELRKQLDEASTKLAATLRSFQIKEGEIDLLQKSLVSTDSERAALAERVLAAEKQAAQAKAVLAGGQESAAQLAALREQLRNAQNQIGQLAAENIQLKNRPAPGAGASPSTPTLVLSAPRRPADTSSPTTAPVRAPQAAEPRIHTVVEGETLTRIARRYYGNSERWAEIYEANRASLPNPAALKIGMKLRIP